MKEGPSRPAVRCRPQNRCKLLSSKAMVVSVAVNVGTISRRVELREASASEPSMKCRKRIRRCQNRGVTFLRDQLGGTLVWGFFCQGVSGRRIFLSSSVSLFDLKAVSSSRPGLRSRRRAQELSRLAVAPTLRHDPALPGHTLTASSTTARLVRSGMTIRGEPAFGRESIAPQPCIRLVQGPEP